MESSSSAPKSLARTTEKPFESPYVKPMSRLYMADVDPTAASASSPRKCPITTVSTTLYNCWNRFPIKIGSEKARRRYITFPSTMLFTELLFVFKFSILILQGKTTLLFTLRGFYLFLKKKYIIFQRFVLIFNYE